MSSIIVEMTQIVCSHEGCGVAFCVPDVWVNARKNDHLTWYCPNGHQRHWPQETEAEKLRRQLDNTKQQIARAEDEAREAAVERDKAVRSRDRMKRRIVNGTCPCCKRSFSNVADHMRSKHPGEVVSILDGKKAKAGG